MVSLMPKQRVVLVACATRGQTVIVDGPDLTAAQDPKEWDLAESPNPTRRYFPLKTATSASQTIGATGESGSGRDSGPARRRLLRS
jgi:hypothetical protein